MKAILEFDMEDLDDRQSHDRCVRALDMALALNAVSDELRRIVEHCEDEEKVKYIEEFKGQFYEILQKYGINLDDLLC